METGTDRKKRARPTGEVCVCVSSPVPVAGGGAYVRPVCCLFLVAGAHGTARHGRITATPSVGSGGLSSTR